MKLPAGYRLPKGKTLADVRRLDEQLLASEGLRMPGHRREEGSKKSPRNEK